MTILTAPRLARRFQGLCPDEFRSRAEFEQFLRKYPAYGATTPLSRRRSWDFPRMGAYLDWTGAGKYGQSQLQAHFRLLQEHELGNPHSLSPDSQAATGMVEAARAAVLQFFNASPDEYVVIFRANASDALRVLGESYPFSEQRNYLYLRDNHNSVLGIREYAQARDAAAEMAGLMPKTLRLDADSVQQWLKVLPPGLFAYPAQSNFSGVQHGLEWIPAAQEQGWDVLLDAAAFAPSNRLDLSRYHPEFVVVSFYKMFGYPTGIGALIARRKALTQLRRPSFSGGTVAASSALGGWHVPAGDPARFEDGTINYQGLAAVPIGLDYLSEADPARPGQGIELIHHRTQMLTDWLLTQLEGMQHRNGTPLTCIYGPNVMVGRGASVALNFLTPDGQVVDERIVQQAAAKQNISLRDGCFCNPGCGEAAFGLPADRLRELSNPAVNAHLTMDERLRWLGMPSGGAIRVSLGQVSTFADVERFLELAAGFRDISPDTHSLPPRGHC